MLAAHSTLLRDRVMPRLRSGENIAKVAADTGVSRSTLYRWKRQSMGVTTKLAAPPRSARIPAVVVPAPPTPTPAPPAPAAAPREMPVEGYVGDMSEPGDPDFVVPGPRLRLGHRSGIGGVRRAGDQQ